MLNELIQNGLFPGQLCARLIFINLFRASEHNIALPPWTLVAIGVSVPVLILLIVAVWCGVRFGRRKSKPGSLFDA